ncbi:MAG TPA: MauE/DoxX family redox-associated membrane protein [Solirubrobacteraceae bacterium]|nr:MauE/DoxX family redox-associated membrane protein [Solirubrobacteraceae bacterium]
MTVQSFSTLVLAVVLTAAATAKLQAPTQFRSVLRDLVPQPAVRPAARMVPVLELAVAVWLLSGVASTAAACAVVALLVLFTAALLRMWRLGIAQDCGCFGEASQASTPASGVVRNVLLLALGLAMLSDPTAMNEWASDAGSVAAHAVAAASLFCLWELGTTLLLRRALLTTGRDQP